MNMSHLAVHHMDIMYDITDLVKHCHFMSIAKMSPQQQFSFSNFPSSGQVSVVFSIVVLGGVVVVDSVVLGASLPPLQYHSHKNKSRSNVCL